MARILSGTVNPTAKLPVSFPLTEADLPHPQLNAAPAASEPQMAKGEDLKSVMRNLGNGLPAFPANYDEKLKVGYKWYDAENKHVLFPFGHGLSYTTYAYSDLSVEKTGNGLTVHFTVKNTGSRAGDEIAQVYAALPASANEPPHRLVGWSRLSLAPGESKQTTVTVDRRMLSIFNENHDAWSLVPGAYQLLVGASSRNLDLQQSVSLQ